MDPKKIYVIAGEASGDLHGANLIEALRAESADPLEIYGVGGDRIRASGAKNFFDLAHFHVTGITDALKRYPQYRRAAAQILSDIRRSAPHAVVLIDNPGFNLHVAEKLSRDGIPVLYFVAPQIWAWAPKRIRKIKRCVKKVLVVFEFEKKIYEENGVPVEWVGHPLKDLVEPVDAAVRPRTARGPVIALLPGSRKGELNMLFDAFIGAADLIRREFPDAVFKLIKAPTFSREFYVKRLASRGAVELVESNTYEAIRGSDVALVCSGTATLECALLGTPLLIAYKGTFLTYILAKQLIRVPYLGLPNLVLGERRFPEFLQYDATPEKLAAEAVRILKSEEVKNTMKKDLARVSEKLGSKGATRRAALEILRFVGATKKT